MKRSNKPLPEVEIISFGEYSGWNKNEKELPHLLRLTGKLKAAAQMEFGMLVRIKKAKGRYLSYKIIHPPFSDASGNPVPEFTGDYQIRTNPADFFLGDSIGPPLDDKKGDWIFSIYFDDQLVAEKVITLY